MAFSIIMRSFLNENSQQDWLNTICGQYLLAKEHTLFDHAVVDLFGFNALQIGELPVDLLKNSRIPNHFQCSPQKIGLDKNLYCEDDFLPFADLSLDLVVLPHRLEYSPRPHQVLREVARVMMPEGHLLLSGFNPHSTWGLKAALKKRVLGRKKLPCTKLHPWEGQFISLTRMKDWLALLGFEVISVTMCCHVPPFEHEGWQKRCGFLDKIGEEWCSVLGGVYFILAKKRAPGMTTIKPVWKKQLLTPALIIRPSANIKDKVTPSSKY